MFPLVFMECIQVVGEKYDGLKKKVCGFNQGPIVPPAGQMQSRGCFYGWYRIECLYCRYTFSAVPNTVQEAVIIYRDINIK